VLSGLGRNAGRMAAQSASAMSGAEATKAANAATRTVRAAAKQVDLLGPGSKFSKRATALAVGSFAVGGVYGVGSGVRKTMIDMNKSLGNPVGFANDYSVRRAFDNTRLSTNDRGTMGLVQNLNRRTYRSNGPYRA